MTEVQFVGTGDAVGSGGRRQSAILLRDRGHTLLLDCGATTVLGLKELGVDPREIDAVAISHFHGDHVSGLPFLLLDYVFADPRDTPITIFGPTGIEDRIRQLTRDYSYSLEDHGRYEVKFREFEIGKPMSSAGFSVTPAPAFHQPETLPHMLRVQTEDRLIVFTGDTGWHDDLPQHARDADLLISECMMLQEGFKYHLSHERLVAERARFSCKQIVLTHLSSEVLAEVDRLEFETVSDGDRLTI